MHWVMLIALAVLIGAAGIAALVGRYTGRTGWLCLIPIVGTGIAAYYSVESGTTNGGQTLGGAITILFLVWPATVGWLFGMLYGLKLQDAALPE
jgi:hypothetical protein